MSYLLPSCSRLEFERYLSTHGDVVPGEKAIVMNQGFRNPRRIRVLESMDSMNPCWIHARFERSIPLAEWYDYASPILTFLDKRGSSPLLYITSGDSHGVSEISLSINIWVAESRVFTTLWQSLLYYYSRLTSFKYSTIILSLKLFALIITRES